jgi:hypothetical protein
MYDIKDGFTSFRSWFSILHNLLCQKVTEDSNLLDVFKDQNDSFKNDYFPSIPKVDQDQGEKNDNNVYE